MAIQLPGDTGETIVYDEVGDVIHSTRGGSTKTKKAWVRGETPGIPDGLRETYPIEAVMRPLAQPTPLQETR